MACLWACNKGLGRVALGLGNLTIRISWSHDCSPSLLPLAALSWHCSEWMYLNKAECRRVGGKFRAREPVSRHSEQGEFPRAFWPEATPEASPPNICFNSFLERLSPCTQALEPDLKMFLDTSTLSHWPAGEGNLPICQACSRQSDPGGMGLLSNMAESGPDITTEDHRRVKRGEAARCRGAWSPYGRGFPAGGQDLLGPFLPISPPNHISLPRSWCFSFW